MPCLRHQVRPYVFACARRCPYAFGCVGCVDTPDCAALPAMLPVWACALPSRALFHSLTPHRSPVRLRAASRVFPPPETPRNHACIPSARRPGASPRPSFRSPAGSRHCAAGRPIAACRCGTAAPAGGAGGRDAHGIASPARRGQDHPRAAGPAGGPMAGRAQGGAAGAPPSRRARGGPAHGGHLGRGGGRNRGVPHAPGHPRGAANPRGGGHRGRADAHAPDRPGTGRRGVRDLRRIPRAQPARGPRPGPVPGLSGRAAARPAAGGHVRHAGFRPRGRTAGQLPGHRKRGPRLPGGNPPPAPGAGLAALRHHPARRAGRRGGRRRAPRPARRCGQRAGVSAGCGRNPSHGGTIAGPCRHAARPGGRACPVRRSRPRRAGRGHRPRAAGHAQGGAGHGHRRDQSDHRRRARGHRRGPCPRAALRPVFGHVAAGDGACFARSGGPAQGARRAHRTGGVLAAVARGRGSRAAPLCPAGNSRRGPCPAAAGTGPVGCAGCLSPALAGCAATRQPCAGARIAGPAGRAGRRRAHDAARAAGVGAAAASAPCAYGGARPRTGPWVHGLLRGGPAGGARPVARCGHGLAGAGGVVGGRRPERGQRPHAGPAARGRPAGGPAGGCCMEWRHRRKGAPGRMWCGAGRGA